MFFADRAFAQVGYNCDSAYVVTALPFSQTGFNTSTVGNPYSSTSACSSTYMNGNDYLFKLIPSHDMNVNITLSNTGQAVGVFVSYKCFDDTTAVCMAQATNLVGNPSIANVALLKDTTYFILVSTNAILGVNQTTAFDIAITELNQIDAAVTSITSPVSGCGLGSQNVTITITNPGADSLYNFNVAYNFNGSGVTTETVTDTILPGDSLNYTFSTPVIFTTQGTYSLIAYSSVPLDGDHSNDTLTVSIINRPIISTFPYTQDFEAGPFTWSAGGVNSSWAFGTPASTIINSAASGVNAWKTNLTGQCNTGELSYVESHCFDLSSMTLPYVELNVWYETTTTSSLNLQVSTDGGASFSAVGAYGDPHNWYNGLLGWSGSAGGWINAKHEITSLAGQANVVFRVQFNGVTGAASEGAAFDDFKIYDSPPADLGVTQIITPGSGCGLTNSETVRVKIKNFGIASQSGFPVAYSLNGGSTFVTENVSSTILPGDSLVYTFIAGADLSVVGTYNFIATTQLAGDGDHTNDTTTTVITVFPIISTYPYDENFDGGDSYWMAGGTNSSWALGTPAKPTIDSAASSPNSWVTNLTGDQNSNENSWVETPCLDFSSMTSPFIKLDIWYETSILGSAQLQSSTDDGATWTTIGANGDPNNWYNGLLNTGWSGSSGGWLTASHALTSLGGLSDVKLRVLNNGGVFLTAEGLAFDNIHIFDCPTTVAGFFSTPNGQTVSFTNTSTNATTYSWDFGDGNTSSLQDPSNTYATPGTYTVTLVATNACGTNTITHSITIVGINEFGNDSNLSLFPNPTKDNCILTVNNITSGNAAITIYDMQGQLVYSEFPGLINSTFSTKLNFSNYAKGVYYLKFVCNNENHVAKIVVE